MDTRYCVELDLDEMIFTVHRQSCIKYPHSWMRISRVVDLGSYDDSEAALLQARKDYPSPWHCAQCLCLFWNEGLSGEKGSAPEGPKQFGLVSPLV